MENFHALLECFIQHLEMWRGPQPPEPGCFFPWCVSCPALLCRAGCFEDVLTWSEWVPPVPWAQFQSVSLTRRELLLVLPSPQIFSWRLQMPWGRMCHHVLAKKKKEYGSLGVLKISKASSDLQWYMTLRFSRLVRGWRHPGVGLELCCACIHVRF